MKVRTQDATRYVEYGETFASYYGKDGEAGVYMVNLLHQKPVLLGIYEDMERARGVMYEIGVAYQNHERVFYAPSL